MLYFRNADGKNSSTFPGNKLVVSNSNLNRLELKSTVSVKAGETGRPRYESSMSKHGGGLVAREQSVQQLH